MTDRPCYKPRGLKERLDMIASTATCWLEKKWPAFFSLEGDPEIDIYASSMTRHFNWFHRIIFPRFFKKIHVEDENIELICELSKTSTIVYVGTNIGQLEYNFFNYLFLERGLPLARFVNELSLWQWLPFKELRFIAAERARRFKDMGPLPHPISSGYAGALLECGESLFIRLRTTAIYNDLYWYDANRDPVTAVLSVLERENKPIYIVPLHFMWDKRPERTKGSIVNILPRSIRKTVLFWNNYKNKAVVKIGAPIRLSEFVSPYASHEITERSRNLRSDLLKLLQQEKKAITGPPLKPRSWLIEELLEDDLLQRTVYEVSLEKKGRVEDVKLLARKYAEEIAADINYNYVETGYRIMRWVLKNIYDGISIDNDGLSKIKKAAIKAPIILVPNHRSHMDYLLLSTVLYDNNVAIPHVAAGLNLSFWPMGHIFRRCGAFFLRRSFAGNRLYRTVFKTYLKVLLKEGYCQEFFIEGGRSRTGKLLRPKTGMLTMIAESMNEGAAAEAYFVPVAITYDKIIEEYKKELEGDGKKKERTRDLLRLGKYLRRKYGRIYVRFGEPILYLGNTAPDLKPCENSPCPRAGTAESVNKLANAITAVMNREMVVTPGAVTAAAVLAYPRKGITRDEIMTNAEEIMNYLTWRGTSFSESLKKEHNAAIAEAVEQFVQAKYLELHDEFDPVCYEIKDGSRLNLDYYKNNIIHFFISAACLSAIRLSYMRKGIGQPSMEDLKQSYIFCKRLFAFEFAFSTRMDVESHITKILSYFDANPQGTARLELYKGLITNFFESYLVAITACRGIDKIEERNLVKMMVKCGRHMLLLGRITMPEAVSTPNFKNAIDSLRSMGILTSETDAKGRKFYTWAGKEEIAENLKLKLEELC